MQPGYSYRIAEEEESEQASNLNEYELENDSRASNHVTPQFLNEPMIRHKLSGKESKRQSFGGTNRSTNRRGSSGDS
jgi:hypothetical protein